MRLPVQATEPSQLQALASNAQSICRSLAAQTLDVTRDDLGGIEPAFIAVIFDPVVLGAIAFRAGRFGVENGSCGDPI